MVSLNIHLSFVVIALCLPLCVFSIKTITVAADGSGNYKTVQEAVNSLPDNSDTWTEIYIKPATYKEHIIIKSSKTFLRIVGGGKSADQVVLAYDITTSTPNTTYGTSGAFVAENNDFYVEGVTFYNTHGEGTQAIAASFSGERQEFTNCIFKGYQDTLFMGSGLQYFSNCTIHGAVDYIYGGSTAVFSQCTINSVAGGALTAPNTAKTVEYGITFLHCSLTADSGVGKGSTYLGRTWGPYAKADYLYCYEGAHINPVGWSNMGNPANQPTARLGEYQNTGPGNDPSKRVSWSSQLSSSEAAQYTVQNILGNWKPTTLIA